jgi:hypothetical protein
MTKCLTTDELVTISDALGGNPAAGLQHLQMCGACREQIEDLAVIRTALSETEPVNDEILVRCAAVAGRGGTHEGRATPTGTSLVATAVEALLAGLTAPVAVISSGLQLGPMTAGAVGLACGLAVLAFRTIDRRRFAMG